LKEGMKLSLPAKLVEKLVWKRGWNSVYQQNWWKN
jgi:hypothetical protein